MRKTPEASAGPREGARSHHGVPPARHRRRELAGEAPLSPALHPAWRANDGLYSLQQCSTCVPHAARLRRPMTQEGARHTCSFRGTVSALIPLRHQHDSCSLYRLLVHARAACTALHTRSYQRLAWLNCAMCGDCRATDEQTLVFARVLERRCATTGLARHAHMSVASLQGAEPGIGRDMLYIGFLRVPPCQSFTEVMDLEWISHIHYVVPLRVFTVGLGTFVPATLRPASTRTPWRTRAHRVCAPYQ